ncbi:DNA polymerase III subunit beta [Anaerovorax sp. IOR16]|uniref:DNA polymerase III subunit beta n=1 Tax=Anaerovorax sp. IOR16 TaxID=2773458 RepID=UPI0019D0A8C9|nr:DNA polymerase III subunit beta [Anaerovorax sp. IOR16]
MIIEKAEISGKLQKIKSAIPTRVQIECLKGVLLKNNTLYANNLEMGMSAKLSVDTDEEFIIPQKAIDMILSLPDGEVSITCDKNNSLTIKTKNIKNKFRSFSASEFPPMPYIEGPTDTSVGIDCEKLCQALNSVIYAVAINEAKPQMSGVLFEARDGKLNLVGCDGYRLAWAKIDYDVALNIIIPRETIQRLLQFSLKGNVSIFMNAKSSMFRMEEFSIYTRLLNGSYIDYEKMYPTPSNSTIVNRNALVESVNRASICTDDKGKPKIILDIENDTMRISTTSAISDYSEEIRLEGPIDEPIRIGFNGRYLIDCLKSYDYEHIEMGFTGPQSPVVVGDNSLKSLVLPIRLNN